MTLGFLIVGSLALGLGAWALFVWSVRSGQYDDPEGPKYRMLDDDDDPEGPGQGRGPGKHA
jgi:cbb3-type cytochrome oxidase maturation protein